MTAPTAPTTTPLGPTQFLTAQHKLVTTSKQHIEVQPTLLTTLALTLHQNTQRTMLSSLITMLFTPTQLLKTQHKMVTTSEQRVNNTT